MSKRNFHRAILRTGATVAIGAFCTLGFTAAQASTPHTASPSIASKGTFSHLYADTGDGSSCGSQPDAIDVFDSTGTLKQAFTTDANQCHGFAGANPLAFVTPRGNTAGCLVLADMNGGNTTGYVDSFLLTADATIAAEVSHVADPNGGTPVDVQGVKGGFAIVADNTATLEKWTVNKTCTLGKVATSTGGSGAYGNTAVWGKTVYAANIANNTVDTYSLSTMALTHSQASAVSCCTDGISVLGKIVATGAFNGQSQVQADTGNTTPYTAASDPNVSGGTSQVGLAKGCLFGGTGGNAGVVSIYTVKGSVPTYRSDATFSGTGFSAGSFLNVGSSEFWTDDGGGQIWISTISANCGLTPQLFATESDTSTQADDGLAVH